MTNEYFQFEDDSLWNDDSYGEEVNFDEIKENEISE